MFCYRKPFVNSLIPSEAYLGNLTIIAADNGLSPGRHQAIICIDTGIFLIGLFGTNFSGMLIEILTAEWRAFCLGLNVLKCTEHLVLEIRRVLLINHAVMDALNVRQVRDLLKHVKIRYGKHLFPSSVSDFRSDRAGYRKSNFEYLEHCGIKQIIRRFIAACVGR